MCQNELFERDQLENFLYKYALIPAKNSDDNLKIFWNKCNRNCITLHVSHKNFNIKYDLWKIVENDQENKSLLSPDLEQKSIVLPSFNIQDKNNQLYVAFNKEYIQKSIPVQRNCLKYLKTLLKFLARYQVLALSTTTTSKTEPEMKNNIIRNLEKSMEFIKFSKSVTFIDPVTKTVQSLANEFIDISTKFTVVPATGCRLFANGDSTALKFSVYKFMPPAFEALLYIFVLSNEQFRQQHFWQLIDYYFMQFENSIKKSPLSLDLSDTYKEKSVRVLLPLVKLELVKYSTAAKDTLEELSSNLQNYFQYPLINQEDIYQIVENKLETNNYDLLNYKVEPFSEKNGHLGLYCHVYITVRVDGVEEHYQLFAKFLIPPNDHLQLLLDSGPTKKEDFFYGKIIPMYKANGLGDLIDYCVKCYLSRPSRLLILDNMLAHGYVSLTPDHVLDHNGLRVIINRLAKFHVCSLLFEEMQSEKMGKTIRLNNEIGEALDEVLFYVNNKGMESRYYRGKDSICYIIDLHPELIRDVKLSREEINRRIEKAFTSMFTVPHQSDRYRNTLTHGDVYIGNMLLKFDDDVNNNRVTDAIFVDYQMIRYCPPAYELIFFLYLNSTKATRTQYLSQLIDEYYETVAKYLSEFGYDSHTCFPRESFMSSIDYVKPASLFVTFLYASFAKLKPEIREELFSDSEQYRYYMEDTFKPFIDWIWSNNAEQRDQLFDLVDDFIQAIVEHEFE